MSLSMVRTRVGLAVGGCRRAFRTSAAALYATRGTQGPEGMDLLREPLFNKGMAFTEKERDEYKLRGLLPPRIISSEVQLRRALTNLREQPNDLARYVFLRALADRNETLFYRTIMENVAETMPIIYTPTVGAACLKFGQVYRRPRGMYISAEDKGRVREVLDNWPIDPVRVIVVTDGERILGLGDLGAYGMGIPVGKLSLYTALAGVPPQVCLPVTIDVGTNNTRLIDDDHLYCGLPIPRIRGRAYDELIDEFIKAVVDKWGSSTLIQFEDFGNQNAFRFLHKYKDKCCTFNDDIQGTAAVSLAGIMSAIRISGGRMEDQRLLFAGAGGAGTGIGGLWASALQSFRGLDSDDAHKRVHFFDQDGLLCKSRIASLAEHQKPFAHDMEHTSSLVEAIRRFKPTVLVGVSGQGGLFTREVIKEMAANNTRPVIMALSNPTSHCECTAEQAYSWSEGRAIFATGSPFDPFALNGRLHHTAQVNNAYVFPGVGLGVLVSGSTRVTENMFLRAAQLLADSVEESDLAKGSVFPGLHRIREISAVIAAEIAKIAFDEGLATVPRPKDIPHFVKKAMYTPDYDKVYDWPGRAFENSARRWEADRA